MLTLKLLLRLCANTPDKTEISPVFQREVDMFTVKSLDGSMELSHCDTPRHAIEKAGALWISTGGYVKISDAQGRDYTPDQFRTVYEPEPGPLNQVSARL